MTDVFKIRIKKLLKIIKLDIPYYIVLDRFFLNKVAVTVEKDLSSTFSFDNSLYEQGLKLAEITPESIMPGKKQSLIYPAAHKTEDRCRKAAHYLNKGYEGLALVSGRKVCGDIWYVRGQNNQKGRIHPDLKWLGIQCGADEAYAFDMHLYPEHRGRNRAVLLQGGLLYEMQKKGIARAFGYYWAAYIPALWVHRTLRWKETSRIRVSRFLFILRSVHVPASAAKLHSAAGKA